MLMNTKSKGQVRFLIIETSKKYIGICYEFAIVLEDTDKDNLLNELLDAAKGYVDVVSNKNMPNSLLDKSYMLPKEYKQLFDELETRMSTRKVVRKTTLC